MICWLINFDRSELDVEWLHLSNRLIRILEFGMVRVLRCPSQIAWVGPRIYLYWDSLVNFNQFLDDIAAFELIQCTNHLLVPHLDFIEDDPQFVLCARSS